MKQSELEAELERHHAASFGWALACCRFDRREAEDVQQEACLRILDGRARFDGRASFRTWLFGVIRRTAAGRRRRSAALRRALARMWIGAAGSVSPDPEGDLHLSRESARLVSALAKLPDRQRQVLHLVFYDGLPIRESAAVLGVSPGTARTHYERGKRRLRELLGEEGR